MPNQPREMTIAYWAYVPQYRSVVYDTKRPGKTADNGSCSYLPTHSLAAWSLTKALVNWLHLCLPSSLSFPTTSS